MGGSSLMVGRLGVRGELWAPPRTLMLEMDQTSLSSAIRRERREMRAAHNETDGGSDGDGEAMHRGNMQGEVEVPGR